MAQPVAYIYVRFSSEIQRRGDSLRRQKSLAQAYAREHGLRLGDYVFEDHGRSAFTGENLTAGSELSRFLKMVEDGQIERGSYLLVEAFDRLSRMPPLQALQLVFQNIVNQGINLVTLTDGKCYPAGQNIDGAAVQYSVAAMVRAHDESELKSQRIRASWASKRADANRKKLTRTCPAWLRLSADRKKFEPIQERAKVVRSIFRDSIDGYGHSAIAQRLNKLHVTPFNNSDGWHATYIGRIVSNRAVLGEFQPHTTRNNRRVADGDPIAGYYPQIITNSDFLDANRAVSNRKVNGAGRKGRAFANIFSGIAVCSYCDAKMRLVDKGSKPKGGKYLRCANAERRYRCEASGWPYSDFERSFLSFVANIDLDAVLNADQLNRDRVHHRAELDNLTSERDRIRIALNNLASAIEEAAAPIPTLTRRVEQNEQELARIEIQLIKLNAVQATVESARRSRPKVIGELRELISGLGHETSNNAAIRTKLAAHLRDLIRVVYVQPDGSLPHLVRDIRNEPDPSRKAALEADLDGLISSNPLFVVKFRDGQTQALLPDRQDPFQLVGELHPASKSSQIKNGLAEQSADPDASLIFTVRADIAHNGK